MGYWARAGILVVWLARVGTDGSFRGNCTQLRLLEPQLSSPFAVALAGQHAGADEIVIGVPEGCADSSATGGKLWKPSSFPMRVRAEVQVHLFLRFCCLEASACLGV
jgi:hypothetical protein